MIALQHLSSVPMQQIIIPKLSDLRLELVPLTKNDANRYHELYTTLDALEVYNEKAILDRESPSEFTARILSYCVGIWTIRLTEEPDKIIGDCALHHWMQVKGEIEIGGTLFPDFWGRNMMQEAFSQLFTFAQQTLNVHTIIGITQANNSRATRMVLKLGFKITSRNENEIILKKKLSYTV